MSEQTSLRAYHCSCRPRADLQWQTYTQKIVPSSRYVCVIILYKVFIIGGYSQVDWILYVSNHTGGCPADNLSETGQVGARQRTSVFVWAVDGWEVVGKKGIQLQNIYSIIYNIFTELKIMRSFRFWGEGIKAISQILKDLFFSQTGQVSTCELPSVL